MLKKRLNGLYAAFFIIIIALLWFINGAPLFSDYGGNTELYLKSYSSECRIIKAGKFGFLAEIYKTGEATEVINADEKKILNDFSAKTVFVEEIHGVREVYAYSKKIRYKKRIKGKIVNLHIVTSKNTVKVGSPIIFGSF